MNANTPAVPGTTQRTLDAVAEMSLRSVPGAVSVSVTLVTTEGARTVAATSDWAMTLDQAQYAAGDGPCVEASVGGEICEMTDAAHESRWPAFTAAALAGGALSSMSIPIPVDDDGVVGALNVFASTPSAFNAADRVALMRLAGTAAAALTTVPIGSGPLRTRAVVDQAKGILMSANGCSAIEALDLLTRSAGPEGRSLVGAAEELVRATTGP